MQSRAQGLLSTQNGGLEKTLVNSRSRDLKLANHKPTAILNQSKSTILSETTDLFLKLSLGSFILVSPISLF